jgi:hypothetical protein
LTAKATATKATTAIATTTTEIRLLDATIGTTTIEIKN